MITRKTALQVISSSGSNNVISGCTTQSKTSDDNHNIAINNDNHI